MKFPVILAAAVVCSSLVNVATAQSSNLDAMVEAALQNNPDIRAAESRWKAAQAGSSRAASFDDPMIGATAERTDTTSFGDYADIQYMVEQKLPSLGKRGLMRRAADGEARMAEMQYRMKSLETVSMVKRAYYDLWQARHEMLINDMNQDLLRQFVDVALAKYEAGKTMQGDVLKAKTELSQLIETRSDQQRAVNATAAELARLTGSEPEMPPMTEDLVPHFDMAHGDMMAAALNSRPELVGIRQGGVAAAQAELDLAKKGYTPDFLVRVEARQFEGSGGIREYDTGIFMNFPWFNRARNSSAIVEAKLKLDATQDAFDAMKRKTMAEVRTLQDGIHTMQHHYELYNATIIPQQRAAVEAARAAYESDKGDFLDLLDAQRMLLDFEMQNLHHAAEAFRLAAQLEEVVGGDLSEVKP